MLDELGAHVGRRHEGFVLHRNGEPVNYNDLGYHWRRAVLAAELGRWMKDPTTERKRYAGMRYHALRHGFASMLISEGCSVKAVSKALGHSSAATTLNLYAHLWPGDEDRIRQAVDRALAPAGEDWLRTSGTAK